MYDRIVLAYDGTAEGRAALSEGALLARAVGAKVYLLSVVNASEGVMLGEAAMPGAVAYEQDSYEATFKEGLQHLRDKGFAVEGRLIEGEPAQVIVAFAKEVAADLVVVGHKRRNAVQRWWSGSTDGEPLDLIGCSLLVAGGKIGAAQAAAGWPDPPRS